MRGAESNGHAGGDESDGSGSERDEQAECELLVDDPGLPARALAALNALRKSRQHYDVLLLAGGEETPAHRAVLAAASPYLLEALGAPAAPAEPATPPAAPVYRVPGVDAASVRALVEFAYTGRLRGGGSGAGDEGGCARRLYTAAWRLRMEAARGALAERLVRRVTPQDCLELRALPDLAPHLRHALDTFIAQHFEEVCSAGVLGALPAVRAELLRESSAEDGGEAPRAVADAALAWLRDRAYTAGDLDLEDLCSRTHLLFVDGGGELRDCGELPAARGDAPELQQYRRDAAARRARGSPAAPAPPRALPGLELGARERARGAGGDCAVLAARQIGPRATQALLAVRGRLLGARVTWRAAGGPVARGGRLGHAADAPAEPEGERRAELALGRCAHGAAALGRRLLVCGGYDRARVLRQCEAYDPETNAWSPLPDMRGDRARFPAVELGGRVYALGGSDGHNELDSVEVYSEREEGRGGAWAAGARLPGARSHAAAAACAERGTLWLVGGWAGGRSLKAVSAWSEGGGWREAPPLLAARSQCAAVVWGGALWALGGCDAWRCLASTERLSLPAPGEEGGAGGEGAGWAAGPALPTARRSMGGAAWRGRLVSAGGSDGAASLRRVDWLLPDACEDFANASWQPGPPLRRARAGLGLAGLGGALYAAGGFSGQEFLSCVEVLADVDSHWTCLRDPGLPPPPLTPATPEGPGAKAPLSGDPNAPGPVEKKEDQTPPSAAASVD